MTMDIPSQFLFAKCTELVNNPYPEKWVIPKGKGEGIQFFGEKREAKSL
jgi:hypothetical protein